ncbi:MAG: ATP-grasp domain-containing protein [Paludibacteraceae bacterium]|nr:ATP-grasp domain-containing protein [Paludibacteraceae bacterium]
MSNPKKIMLLGGIHYLLPVIKAAHEQGYYVITADYLPDNVAHRYSDEYVNVSIVDKDAVLKVARERYIDGIISFGVDPGVVSAAYVQEKMGLPSMGPYESVKILQNKDLFRAFLAENGFNVPFAKGFADKASAIGEVSDKIKNDEWSLPLIVKPTDSAGSKGVTKVEDLAYLDIAIDEAFDKSISGHIIVEQYIEKVGCSSDTDSFLLNGKFVFMSFNAQRFDADAANPYAPCAYTWPSTFSHAEQELRKDLQRLMTLLNMQTSVFNIETRVSTDGKPYIMECTPRGGGNRLCEMLRYATGKDLITAQVRAAVGDTVDVETITPDAEMYHGHWAEIILHAKKSGVYEGIEIAKDLPAEVVEKDMWVRKGDKVEAFNGANNAIGTLVLRFADKEEMEYAVTHQHEWLRIDVR